MEQSSSHISIPTERSKLIQLFMHRNEQINLSAIRTPEHIYMKHILDALELNKIVDLTNLKVWKPGERLEKDKDHTNISADRPIQKPHTLLDVGTGGGFPLLPLAMTHPHVRCIGLDSTQKKLKAVQAIADELGLVNVSTIRSRAEDHYDTYDIVTARSVTYADKLFPRTLPLIKKGGLLCLYKQRTKEEDDLILGMIRGNNLALEGLHEYTLPEDNVQRVIYIIRR